MLAPEFSSGSGVSAGARRETLLRIVTFGPVSGLSMGYGKGYTIRTGDQVFCIQWTTHRDGRFFPNPMAFEPERWTPEFKKQLPKYAYFPFGGGPRICIGKRFALMEAVLMLAIIGRRYSARLVPGQTLDLLPSVTIRPKKGLMMSIQRRR